MKLEDLKFWEPTKDDLTKLKNYLEKEFPEACFMSPSIKGNIKMTDGAVVIEQSIHNWILVMADQYQIDDVFHLFYWQNNSPVDDLIEGTLEYEENERGIEIEEGDEGE